MQTAFVLALIMGIVSAVAAGRNSLMGGIDVSKAWSSICLVAWLSSFGLAIAGASWHWANLVLVIATFCLFLMVWSRNDSGPSWILLGMSLGYTEIWVGFYGMRGLDIALGGLMAVFDIGLLYWLSGRWIKAPVRPTSTSESKTALAA
jgi:hypothetical protein